MFLLEERLYLLDSLSTLPHINSLVTCCVFVLLSIYLQMPSISTKVSVQYSLYSLSDIIWHPDHMLCFNWRKGWCVLNMKWKLGSFEERIFIFIWDSLPRLTVSKSSNANMHLLSKYDWKLSIDGEGVQFKHIQKILPYLFITSKIWTVMFMK